MLKKNKILLLSFEGADGVGKTTISKKAYYKLKNISNYHVVYEPEFSNSTLGRMIIARLKRKTFFSISSKKNPLAETILLFSDLVYKIEKHFLDVSISKPILIVSDRGYLTFKTYQATRVEEKYPVSDMKEVPWDTIKKMMNVQELTVLLFSHENEIKKRLVKRKYTADSINEVIKFQHRYLDLLKSDNSKIISFDSSNLSDSSRLIDILRDKIMNFKI